MLMPLTTTTRVILTVCIYTYINYILYKCPYNMASSCDFERHIMSSHHQCVHQIKLVEWMQTSGEPEWVMNNHILHICQLQWHKIHWILQLPFDRTHSLRYCCFSHWHSSFCHGMGSYFSICLVMMTRYTIWHENTHVVGTSVWLPSEPSADSLMKHCSCLWQECFLFHTQFVQHGGK